MIIFNFKIFKFLKQEKGIIILLVGITYLILGAKFLRFILRYTENILFWDQWDIFNVILREQPIRDLFFYQQNEHRMGASLIVIKFLAYLSRWDVRFETISIGLIILATSIIALFLKLRLTRKLEIFDMIIPFIFLNLYQYENLLWGFQIGFVMPLLILFSCCYLFTLKNSLAKNIAILFFVLISVYSHFQGIFVGVIAALYFLVNFIEKYKGRSISTALFLGLTIIIILSYFINYVPPRFLGGEHFNFSQFIKYIALQFNGFIGNYSTNPFVWLIPSLLVISLIHLIIKSYREKGLVANFAIFSLYLFSFLFAISTAYGRGGVGIGGAYTSRYVTMMIPIFLGLYLYLAKFTFEKIKNTSLTFLLVFFVFTYSQNNLFNYIAAQNRKSTLESWKKCYLENESIEFCDQKTNSMIYHSPSKINLKSKIDYLKNNRLNFYKF